MVSLFAPSSEYWKRVANRSVSEISVCSLFLFLPTHYCHLSEGVMGKGTNLRREAFLCLATVCSDSVNAGTALRSNALLLTARAFSIDMHDPKVLFAALALLWQCAEVESQKITVASGLSSVRSESFVNSLVAVAMDGRREMSLVRRTALGVLGSFMRTADMVLAMIKAGGCGVVLNAIRAGRDCDTVLRGMICIQRLAAYEPGVQELLKSSALRDILVLSDPDALPQVRDETATKKTKEILLTADVVPSAGVDGDFPTAIGRIVGETLVTLSQSVLVQDAFVSMGSLHYCRPLLLSADPQCQCLGAQLVVLWTFPESYKRFAVEKAQLLPILIELLSLDRNTAAVVVAASAAIKSLASLPENKKEIIQCGGIPHLVRLLHSNNDLIQTPVAGTLRLLATGPIPHPPRCQ